MIINDGNLLYSLRSPDEGDAPLPVDANRVIAFQISFKSF